LIEQHYLDDCLFQLRKLKAQGDKAMAQVDDRQFFSLLDADANSIALVAKHVAGNMRSRWTDFLASDGEKADRDRDSEFDRDSGDTREAILARWEAGWELLFSTLASLRPADLGKTVTIRREPHTVVQAINRQVSHYSAHVGQIVLLAKHFAGANWKTLSIPKKTKTAGG
jgi:hypothetical protein